jgi:hypothetical protein
MFFQSAGCCDGGFPLCFRKDEFVTGDQDVLLGIVGGAPYFLDHRQYELWKGTRLTLDAAAGEPEGFSLSAGRDRHFIIRSREHEAPARDVHERNAVSPQRST